MNRFVLQSEAGFSLTELIVVVVIFSLIIGAVTTLAVSGIREHDEASRQATLQDEAQGAMDIMVQAVEESTGVVSGLSSLQLQYQYEDGAKPNVTFSLTNGLLKKTVAGGTTITIAHNVTQFAISFYDANGYQVSLTPERATQVRLDLKLQTLNKSEASVYSSAKLRNK